MKLFVLRTIVLCTVLISGSAQAHKRWLLPTDFNLSDAETITVDFTASNNVFYVDKPMPLDGVRVLSPKGQSIASTNTIEGARRSSFDVAVSEKGTYRIFDRGNPVYFSSYTMRGTEKPVVSRGSLEKLKADIPTGATAVGFAESTALVETYVTLGGNTTPPALRERDGLTMEALSHPSALYTDESAAFRFSLNGKPVSGLTVMVTPEGTRYRNSQKELAYVTDEAGEVAISWPVSGRHLVEAELEQSYESGEFAMRYFSYFLTLEVLEP